MPEPTALLEPLVRHAEILVSNVDKKITPGQRPVRLCNYMDVYTTPYLGGHHDYMLATADPGEVKRFGLQPGDVVITKDSETPDDIGVAAVIDDVQGDIPLVCGYHLAILRPSTVNPVFLAKQLGHGRLKAYFGRMATGSTRYGLPKGAICDVPLFAPPRPEQDRVAVIMRAVDDAIRSAERVIAKMEDVKRGLIHDLLTLGIDDDGQIRDPMRDPEQFKDSPLGRIPRAWETAPFASRCSSSAFGPRFPGQLYAPDGGIATLRTTDIDDEGNIDLTTMPRANVSLAAFKPHLLLVGDLVISRSGTCGVTAVFPGHDVPTLPGAFLIRFRLMRAGDGPFYRRYFNSSLGRPEIDRLAVGGVQKNITSTAVLALTVPVPPPAEMDEVGTRLNAMDAAIDREKEVASKLRLLKEGLFDDLLTGRVRVAASGEHSSP